MRNVTFILIHGVWTKRNEVEETFCEEEEKQEEEGRGECGVHMMKGPDNARINNVVMRENIRHHRGWLCRSTLSDLLFDMLQFFPATRKLVFIKFAKISLSLSLSLLIKIRECVKMVAHIYTVVK